jgi:hypothetical protein
MSHPARDLRLAALAAAALLAAPLVAAEPVAWDQTRAAELAQQLGVACGELYDVFYAQPDPGLASGQSLAYEELKEEIRRIRSEARSLARELEKGRDRAATRRSFERLEQMVRSAQDDARKVFNTAEVREKADAARALLDQLSAYYAPTEAGGGS